MHSMMGLFQQELDHGDVGRESISNRVKQRNTLTSCARSNTSPMCAIQNYYMPFRCATTYDSLLLVR